MKTAKEFFEQLKTDEAFAKEVTEAVTAKREAGAKNYYETFIPVAAEYGYEISKEELDEVYEKQVSELSEEELGKVAGGTSCLTVLAVTTYLSVLTSISYSLKETLSAEEE